MKTNHSGESTSVDRPPFRLLRPVVPARREPTTPHDPTERRIVEKVLRLHRSRPGCVAVIEDLVTDMLDELGGAA